MGICGINISLPSFGKDKVEPSPKAEGAGVSTPSAQTPPSQQNPGNRTSHFRFLGRGIAGRIRKQFTQLQAATVNKPELVSSEAEEERAPSPTKISVELPVLGGFSFETGSETLIEAMPPHLVNTEDDTMLLHDARHESDEVTSRSSEVRDDMKGTDSAKRNSNMVQDLSPAPIEEPGSRTPPTVQTLPKPSSTDVQGRSKESGENLNSVASNKAGIFTEEITPKAGVLRSNASEFVPRLGSVSATKVPETSPVFEIERPKMVVLNRREVPLQHPQPRYKAGFTEGGSVKATTVRFEKFVDKLDADEMASRDELTSKSDVAKYFQTPSDTDR